MNKVTGRIIDVIGQRIFEGEVWFDNKIREIRPFNGRVDDQYILPGFIDAHVHIESSMLVPSEFARLAVVHGTVATVSDPHEIANVLGIDGVRLMIENGKQVPFKFFFGAPSCVPATGFETAGATINVDDVARLLAMPEIRYLAEMMNWPGVLHRDAAVMAKIQAAQREGKPVDGHAPGLRGEEAKRYAAAGITTDHECFSKEEALDKLSCGMTILIREGSAAKNFDALIDLAHEYSDRMMFCSDDKHPDALVRGHVNELVVRAMAAGIDLFKVLRMACVNPVLHYGLDVGLLRQGDSADFITINNVEDFRVKTTVINGQIVAADELTKIHSVEIPVINQFNATPKTSSDFHLPARTNRVRCIEVVDGQLVTGSVVRNVRVENGLAVSDTTTDVLKITVVNRYRDVKPAVGFVRNFGLRSGALASCVAHDSHNIVAVGVDDESLSAAVNLVIANKGGISLANGDDQQVLPLPIAGIMTSWDGYEVATAYEKIDLAAKGLGTPLQSPVMTLSFLALLVIPSLKLSDKGLFDGESFEFVDPFVD